MAEATPGSTLRGLRTAKGWSLEHAAMRLHTSQSTVSRLERDLFMPSIPLAAKIATQLGIPITDWLLSPLALERVA